MLDNEPPVTLGEQGGERDGAATPPVDAATGTTPARRTRAPRRKAAAPGAEEVAETAAAAPAEVVEPTPAPVKKATRSRRKVAEPAPEAAPAAAAEEAAAEAVAETAEKPAPVKKATRSRRKVAAPPAEQLEIPPAAEPSPAPVAPVAPPESPEVPIVGILPLDDDFLEPAEEEPAEEQPAEEQAAAEAEPAGQRPARARKAPLPPPVLFMPPEATEVAPAPVSRRRRPVTDPLAPVATAPAEQPAEPAAAEPVTAEPVTAEAAEEPAEGTRRSRRRRRGAAEEPAPEPVAAAAEQPVLDEIDESDESADDAEDGVEDDGDDDEAGGRRRRRRGRRGRGRGKGPSDEADDADLDAEESEGEAEAAHDEEAEDEESEDGEGGVTRRRRRRRRKGSSGDGETGGIEDGVHTVVRVREPRRSDEVQGVSGSTRLEAKRQRRRDGREQRRTRPPILSESEFLARREAVDRVMVVRQKPDRIQIAVLEDGVLVEHYVARATSGTMVGNVYLGKVQNVLPSMEAAFVDVGRGRNAVLYAGEVNWDATGLEGRARSIEQALRSGDSVLVQVTKDPIGHKGARLTSHIALSGRHLVYVPNGNASGISRKLPDNERKRLRDILKKLVPDGAGVIVRTAAEGASEDELARDVKRLQAQWEDIQARAAEGNAPRALSEEPDLVIRVVRDLFNEDFRELIVQGEQAYAEVENYLHSVSPDLVERLHRHVGVGDVFAENRIDEQILKGLDRKVFLPSGGHLVIDRTEAMTVVDVNTGKYTGAGGNLEETVTRNNLEAAEEIVRQLRLRDLGGIVVIDFIDMVLESNRELVLRRLTECLGRDRTKHQVTEITSLGLVQMTRKRIGAGLLEAFSETCDHCKGRGVIIHHEPVPERRSNGGGAAPAATQVKAVAAAARTEAPPAQPAAATSGRSRRRRGGGDTPPVEVAEVVEPITEQAGPITEEAGPAAEVAELPAIPEVPGTPVAPVAAAAPVAGSGVIRSGVVRPAQPVVTSSADADDYDISGYDLSRYETEEADGAAYEADTEPLRLVGSDDPDAADEDEDDDESVGVGTGRRRSRRSGARRRTRP
ncbi:ribonuclease [Actinoplanes sp. SE50]|uniref:Rne/Rng family ribonuclease n=1 Tax=unclassified Actinoplanes TaxID=2626549 RepID=UPI00023ED57B|nr:MULTISPECIES: Rne/Rng family ribonuclease [unclassified Actinoplanes]AEV82271.1 ribonuclease E [Actinoplanes sp. SE50/110]ATO80668.1 ribonuclease [Actinoplanes sp. SE50]SLL98075.1 ribonuclease [Actinoplanes sp. SE50/110]